jgi:hypothetical protein
MGILELVTAPATEPVTTEEAKTHARVETSLDDTLIETYIAAARMLAEKYTGRAFITQTWKLTLDAWPGASASGDDWWDGCREGAITMLEGAEIEIRKAPFIAITSVNTYDEDAAATLWASTNYYTAPKPGGFVSLVKKRSVSWPTLSRDRGAIVIAFTAGYGATAASVPIAIRQAIKMTVDYWYEHRGDDEATAHMPGAALALLNQFRVAR